MTALKSNIDLTHLLDVPDLPGLSFRTFRGESDYPNILACIRGSKETDQSERSDTLEDIARYYTHLHNCDPYRDVLFVEVEGKAVGYSRVEWNINDDGEWLGFHLGFLLPEWRRKGIGRAMLQFCEERLRQIARQGIAEGQIDASIPRYFEAFCSNTEAGREALLKEQNYQPVRYAYNMLRPLSEPVDPRPLPEGLEVRTATPQEYRAVWDASQEAFRDHWGFIPAPEEEYQKWLLDPTFDPNLWQVAWEGDQVAGMVLNFVNQPENEEYNRKRGYTEGISVRRPWRRRGLARALLTRSLQMFKDMGMTEAALGVDTQNLNGALNLYQSVGFRPYKVFTTYRKPLA